VPSAEYLFLPVVVKEDGRLWFDVQLGIIKRELVLRHVWQIGEGDPDAPALLATQGSGYPPHLGFPSGD